MIATRLASAQTAKGSQRSRTTAVWKEVFQRSGINRLPAVAELCPGDDPKVSHALLDSGFMGNAGLVDISRPRLAELRSELGPVPFRLTDLISSLEDYEPAAGAVVSNHPIDDLALSFFAEPSALSYDALYSRFRRDPEFSRKTWAIISNDHQIREQVVSLLCDIARKCPAGSFFLVSQYQSKYEKLHSMDAETAFCRTVLSDISKRLTSDGTFRKLSWAPGSLAESGFEPNDWLLLRKAAFRSLEIRLTRRCNLRCQHCCAFPFENVDIKTAVAGQVADRYSLPGIKIGFTGGEPFLHRQLGEILSTFANRGTRLSITTNGTVHRPELTSLLASLGVKVKVSIHGSQASHDSLTCANGSFNKALRSIREFVDAGVEVAIQTSIHARNITGALERVELCRILGVRELKVFPLIDQGKAKESSWDGARLGTEQFRVKVSEMAEAGRAHGINVRAMEWPNNGQYVLIAPNGDASANPVDGQDGSLVFGNAIASSPDELWKAYPFKETHLEKYSS
jgi:MoaA/NifB/PqqE/SkfB family radical SAM enzyme